MSKIIINPEELKKKRAHSSLIILDLRSEEAYDRGHIKGAIHLEGKKHFTGQTTYLPDLTELGKTLGEKGINNTAKIVLYDEGNYRTSAKAYYVFYYLNHKELAILDGGIEGWENENNELTTEKSQFKKTNYVISPIESRAVSTEYIKEKLTDDSSVLIDSRSTERFLGKKEPKYKKAGHIPNAVNYVSKDVFTEDGKWRSPNELKEHFQNLKNQDEVIVSCGSGGSACLNLVGLKIAGIENVKMYSDGFSKWIDKGYKIEQEETNL